MKATGIVRRIDDLGRVVIPKEIRKTLRIREGDPLEIFTNRNGEIIFKKYSPLGEVFEFANDLCETISKTTGVTCAVCDKDNIITVAGAGKKELLDQKISKKLESIILNREIKGDESFETASELNGYYTKVVVPIVSDSDAVGAVLLIDDDNTKSLDNGDIKVANSCALFLAKHMS